MNSQSLHADDHDCPAYSEFTVANLTPVTSLANNRYDKMADVTLSHVEIEPGLFQFTNGPEPMYLPPGWVTYTHPEGQPYFHRTTGLRVVTEAYLYRSETMDRVSAWASRIEDALLIKGIKPSHTVELFLQPCEDLESCGYYLVDHATRSEFWIDQVSTEFLGLRRVVSISHLKLALEELYWAHLEYFPMHYDGLSLETVDDLISVFAHGQTDRMTSPTSTFPYSVDDCAKFVQILENARKQDMDGNLTWIVARLCCNIARHRFVHHAGQEFPRLDREQSILATRPDMDHWILRLCSSLCFGLPESHYSRFKKIYVDHEVDARDFRSFISNCLDDWKSSLSWSLPLLMSNILLSCTPSASRFIGMSSIIMCGMSTTSGIILSVRHEGFEKATPELVYSHIDAIRSDNYGFRPSACVFSLPRALCMWGLGLLMVQAMVLTFRLVNTTVAISWTTFVLLIVMGMGQVIFPGTTCPWIRMFEDWFYNVQGYSKGLVCARR